MPAAPPVSGRRSRDKGSRTERIIAAELNYYGIPERKRSGMYIPAHDLDVTVRGRTLRTEVKSRAQGFGSIYNWLNDRDVLIINADYKPLSKRIGWGYFLAPCRRCCQAYSRASIRMPSRLHGPNVPGKSGKPSSNLGAAGRIYLEFALDPCGNRARKFYGTPLSANVIVFRDPDWPRPMAGVFFICEQLRQLRDFGCASSFS